MKAVHVGIIFCSFVFLSSEGLLLGTNNQQAITDAEKVLILEATNLQLTTQLTTLEAQCQERAEEVLDDLEEATEDMNELEVKLLASERQIDSLTLQMSIQMALRAKDQATINDLNQQLLSVQNEVGFLRHVNATLEEEIARCEAAVIANTSAEVQALLLQWAAEDQATMDELNQQVLVLEAANRVLASTNDLLNTQAQRDQETIDRLSEEVGELHKDLKDEEEEKLNAEFEITKLELEMDYQEILLERCQEKLEELKQPAQQSDGNGNGNNNGNDYNNRANGNNNNNNNNNNDGDLQPRARNGPGLK